MKDRTRKRRKLPVTSLPRVASSSSTPALAGTSTDNQLEHEQTKGGTQAIRSTSWNLRRPGAARGSSAHPRASAAVIRRYHVLLKKRAQLLKHVSRGGGSLSKEPKGESLGGEKGSAQELEEVEREIEAMGGLEAYQRMSAIGQSGERGGGAEKVCIAWLIEVGVREAMKKGKGKTRLLDVGALKPDNYASCSSWIQAHPMDLRSRHPDIEEQDFLQMDQEMHREAWDVVCLSLVVNFVPELRDRGKMLTYAHNILRDGGYLFLALPLPCVANSRYLTFEHLTQLLGYLGFEQVKERWKEGGKMAYWLFRKDISQGRQMIDIGVGGADRHRFGKKLVLREGKRNNFCILL